MHKEQPNQKNGSKSTKGSNNKSKNYKPKFKGKDQEQGKEGPNGYVPTRGSNEFSWHTPDAALLERASQVSWSWQTGELVELGKPLFGNQTGPSVKSSQAGIMVIRDQLSVGGAGFITPTSKWSNSTLPTYQAANTLLAEMRARARIRNTYDAPDVFMLNMAMANIYAGIILAKRLAGTARLFTYKNQYLPEALIRVQGFDPDWFKINQYRFVTELNVIISEVNKIYVPNRMHLFELINERFSNYYTEGEDIKDQIYVITPAFLNILSQKVGTWASQISPAMCIPGKILNMGTAGSGMVTQYDAAALYTGDNLLNVLRRCIENVLTEGSTADITGDMANCFGEADRFYIPFADPMAMVTPVYDEEILETIHNMAWSTAVESAYTSFYNQASVEKEYFKIVQDPNDNRIGSYDCFEMAYNPVVMNILESESAHKLIDIHKDPNPQKTFAVTRLRNVTGMRTLDSTTTPTTIYVQMMFSTDLICQVEVYWFAEVGGNPALSINPLSLAYDPTNSGSANVDIMTQAFHYRPLRIQIDPNTGYRLPIWVDGETDIWAEIDWPMYNTSNTISLMTLLGAYNNV